MTTRRLMAVVAAIALGVGLAINLARRRSDFGARFREHFDRWLVAMHEQDNQEAMARRRAMVADLYRGLAATRAKEGSAAESRRLSELADAEADAEASFRRWAEEAATSVRYHSDLSKKYRWAYSHPWLPVRSGPREPK
jgi:hypothetical protein